MDKVRNETIREQCGIQEVRKFIKTRKSEWNDHVTRARENRLIKISRDFIPSGKRNPDHQKDGLKDGYPLQWNLLSFLIVLCVKKNRLYA